MARLTKGARALLRWREEQEGRGDCPSWSAISEAIGDRGGQLAKWVNGRPTLPIRLKVALANYTGLSLEELAEPDELQLARELFALMARDAAGNAA